MSLLDTFNSVKPSKEQMKGRLFGFLVGLLGQLVPATIGVIADTLTEVWEEYNSSDGWTREERYEHFKAQILAIEGVDLTPALADKWFDRVCEFALAALDRWYEGKD